MNPTLFNRLRPACAVQPNFTIPLFALREEAADFETEHDFLVQNLRADLLESQPPAEAIFAIDLP